MTRKLTEDEVLECCRLIGKGVAGLSRMDIPGQPPETIANRKPEKYKNALSEWMDILVAQAKFRALMRRTE